MKPLPAPNIPGNTEAEKFDSTVRKMFIISKEELLKREAKRKPTRTRKRRSKRS